MKKLLVFNGSPRKNGDTAFLLKHFAESFKGEIKTVNCYFDDIAPCVDCRSCRETPRCVFDDKMNEIYEYAKHCDAVLIATPIYYEQPTGKLLDVVSRFQLFYNVNRFGKEKITMSQKKGAVILVGGGDGNPKLADYTAQRILKCLNCKEILPSVVVHNTDVTPACCQETALKETEKLAQLLSL